MFGAKQQVPARGEMRIRGRRSPTGSAAQFRMPPNGQARCGVSADRSSLDLSRHEWRWEPVYLKKAKPLDGLLRDSTG